MNTARTGSAETRERDIAFEGVDLSPKSIAPHRHIDRAQGQRLPAARAGVENLAGEHDHARTGTVGRQPVGQQHTQRLQQVEVEQQVAHGGGFPAGNHQRVDRLELAAPAHRHRLCPGFTQRRQVLAGVALQRQDPDPQRAHCWVGRYPRGKRVRPSCMTAATISPDRVKILPWHSARPPQADGEDWS